MIDISLWSFIAVAIVVLLTACTQAVVGFGFALLAVPVMMQIVGLQRAVILASLIGTANNVFQYQDLKHNQDKQQVKRFLLASCVGAPFGLVAFIYANQQVLKILLGIGVLFGVLLLARGRDLTHAHVSLDWSMGVISGFLLTSTSTNGPPLVFAMQARKSDPQVFRSTLNMVFLVSGIYGLVLFAAFGEIALSEIWISLALLPSMIAGVYAGRLIRSRVDPDRFRMLVLILLALAGLSSLYSGLLG
ncbi:hypothetical protein LBMAG07_10940 [Actinomycetes bacterium]|nr:hypothetical protein LBMAG07_10940 [Actinomycetes bacterium]